MEINERSLVTIAIISYNQEKYIRDAIRGAFSQTYSPLEIVLSDDGSTDRTYEVMVEMAAAYNGCATIKLNRNSKNMGIGGHIERISEVSTGEVIVMAAGDDISSSDRVLKIVSEFMEHKDCYAVFSAASHIDENGGMIVECQDYWVRNKKIKLFDLAKRGGGVGLGATYAYKKDCFTWPEGYPSKLSCEDRVLPWRAGLLGDVIYIDKPLVRYRLSEGGVSRSLVPEDFLVEFNDEHISHLQENLSVALVCNKINKFQAFSLGSILGEIKAYRILARSINKKNGLFSNIKMFILRAHYNRFILFRRFI